MISKLTGKIEHIEQNFVILSVNDVGYKVFIPMPTLASLKINQKTTLWTYLAVKEDALDLYGFYTKDELDFFELMISISGIGPKKALGFLSLASVDILKRAIRTEDLSYLTEVSGIGKKNAEKIIIELRDKLGPQISSDADSLTNDAQTIEAIKSLGFSAKEARDVSGKIPPEIRDVAARVKEALKILTSQH